MQEIKLLAMDLDGTLLNSKKEVSPYTKRMLWKMHEKKIPIVISSGRMMEAIDKFQKMIGFRCYRSALNGAYILDDNNQIMQNCTFPDTDFRNILNYLEGKEVYFNVSSIDTLYCRSELFEARKRNYGVNTKVLSGHEMIHDNKIKGNRIIVETKNSILLTEIRKFLLENFRLEITKSEECNIELMPESINKGSGLEKICCQLNIPLCFSAVFGDGENDVSMFQKAGLKIAMGNATDILKNISDFVTKSNDEDGIALAIEHFLSLSCISI